MLMLTGSSGSITPSIFRLPSRVDEDVNEKSMPYMDPYFFAMSMICSSVMFRTNAWYCSGIMDRSRTIFPLSAASVPSKGRPLKISISGEASWAVTAGLPFTSSMDFCWSEPRYPTPPEAPLWVVTASSRGLRMPTMRISGEEA